MFCHAVTSEKQKTEQKDAMKSFIVPLRGINLPLFPNAAGTPACHDSRALQDKPPHLPEPELLAGPPPGTASLLPLTLHFLELMLPKAFALPPKSRLQLLL